jgi:hypothetical protein
LSEEQAESSRKPFEDAFKALSYDCEGKIEGCDLQVMSKLSLCGNLKRSVSTPVGTAEEICQSYII